MLPPEVQVSVVSPLDLPSLLALSSSSDSLHWLAPNFTASDALVNVLLYLKLAVEDTELSWSDFQVMMDKWSKVRHNTRNICKKNDFQTQKEQSKTSTVIKSARGEVGDGNKHLQEVARLQPKIQEIQWNTKFIFSTCLKKQYFNVLLGHKYIGLYFVVWIFFWFKKSTKHCIADLFYCVSSKSVEQYVWNQRVNSCP